MENGIGGFTPDGREYVIVLDGDRETPLPWSNVLANPEFGTDRERVGRGVYVGGQQSREPADAVRQRSRQRSRQAKRSSCATRTTGAVWGATPAPLPRRRIRDGGWSATGQASRIFSTRLRRTRTGSGRLRRAR